MTTVFVMTSLPAADFCSQWGCNFYMEILCTHSLLRTVQFANNYYRVCSQCYRLVLWPLTTSWS